MNKELALYAVICIESSPGKFWHLKHLLWQMKNVITKLFCLLCFQKRWHFERYQLYTLLIFIKKLVSMFWSRDEITCLIEQYTKWPDLYNEKLLQFQKRNLRMTAFECILEEKKDRLSFNSRQLGPFIFNAQQNV